MDMKGKVWLVGAGPGDAGLLTVKAEQLLHTADVIVYDALVSPEIICKIPEETERIYVGKRGGHHSASQEEINQILLDEALKGKAVVRLKGGDPFVFGRGGEELELLIEHGIPYEVVPGITSAVSVPAYAGIPVTHRDFVSSVHFITGHPRKGGNSRVDYEALVKVGGTLVFLMGISESQNICDGLLGAGMKPQMPAAVIMQGTRAGQRSVYTTLEHLTEKIAEEGMKAPAIIIIGEVASLGERFDWMKYLPLSGKTFLLTRPKERISGLAGKLRELGAHVIELPTIRTEAIKNNVALKELWTYHEGERWLVFTSPAGVHAFFEEMMELSIDLRRVLTSAKEVKVAAIGSATAKELRAYGLMADVVPQQYCARELGEDIAKIASPGNDIVILRAKEGSEELLPPLMEAGLAVRDIPLYETKYELNDSMKESVEVMFEQGEIDGVTFTSKSTVKGFVQAVQNIDYTKVSAICIGEQTAKEAANYGMQIMISEESRITSMIDLVLEQFGKR